MSISYMKSSIVDFGDNFPTLSLLDVFAVRTTTKCSIIIYWHVKLTHTSQFLSVLTKHDPITTFTN